MATLKRDIGIIFTGNVVKIALALGISVILARLLGPEKRGLYGLALLIPALVAQFGLMGQTVVNSVYPGLYKDKRSQLFIQSVVISIAGALIGGLFIGSFYYWLPGNKGEFSKLSNDIITISLTLTPFIMLHALFIALLRGIGRVGPSALVLVVQSAIHLVALCCVFYGFGVSMRNAMVCMIIGQCLSILLSIWYLRDILSFSPFPWSFPLFKKSICFGSQVGMTSLAQFLIYRIDRGILAFMVPATELGFYLIAVGLAEKLRLFPGSVAQAFLPWLAKDVSNRQERVPKIFRLTIIASFGLVPVIAVLGIPSIYLLFGKEYVNSIATFLVLLPGIGFLGGASVISSDLAAREKPKYSMITAYVVLVINVILNIILIPVWGIIGAAVASTISYSCSCAFILYFYLRITGIHVKELAPQYDDVRFLWRHTRESLQKYLKRYPKKP